MCVYIYIYIYIYMKEIERTYENKNNIHVKKYAVSSLVFKAAILFNVPRPIYAFTTFSSKDMFYNDCRTFSLFYLQKLISLT